MTLPEFKGFPKMARLSREVVVTEKIDGSNAQIYITDEGDLFAGSRSQWITPEKDNFGFAKWVERNKEELLTLGHGQHFGEWWGNGIQRGYGLKEKRFSLFNTFRWSEVRPPCCHVVPILWKGIFETEMIEEVIERLRIEGSHAAPGFMKPEGVIVFHTAGNFGLKKTLDNDGVPKGMQV